MPFWIWIIIIAVIVFGIFPLPILGFYLYSVLLVRTSKKKWGRECSIPDDEEYKRMFDIGIAWDEQYASRKQPVEIESDGLNSSASTLTLVPIPLSSSLRAEWNRFCIPTTLLSRTESSDITFS